jgi:D-sedoheptulose 7-phosphate isomerase
MTQHEFYKSYLQDLRDAIEGLEAPITRSYIMNMIQLLRMVRKKGRRVYLCGNGGSLALASHMATDLQLGGLRAEALTDVSALTTYANDHEYGRCFADQIEVLADREDVLIALSGSGNSPNILQAIDVARRKGLQILGFCGMDGGEMRRREDGWTVHLPAKGMGASQDVQGTALHLIAYTLINDLKGTEN